MIRLPMRLFGYYYRLWREKGRFTLENIEDLTAIPVARIAAIEANSPPDTDEVAMLLYAIGRNPPDFIFD